MALISTRLLSPLFLALQWHLAVYFVLSSSSRLVEAQSSNISHIPREEDDLADFGQAVPILGQVSNICLGITATCFAVKLDPVPSSCIRM